MKKNKAIILQLAITLLGVSPMVDAQDVPVQAFKGAAPVGDEL